MIIERPHAIYGLGHGGPSVDDLGLVRDELTIAIIEPRRAASPTSAPVTRAISSRTRAPNRGVEQATGER
jgi:hypothetical protein